MKVVYFKELAHRIVGAVKSKICRVGRAGWTLRQGADAAVLRQNFFRQTLVFSLKAFN